MSNEETPPLDGFEDGFAVVNGIRLHYVIGGAGKPLVLLGGWSRAWWQFHKMMPALAERYRVIAVDLRGMGDSDKPATGYDKKTMASDIHQLVRTLGYDQVAVAGEEDERLASYAYVHVGSYVDDMARTYQQSLARFLPDEPLLVVGQTSVVDPTRVPMQGQHSLWVQVRTVPGSVKGDAAGRIAGTTWSDAREADADRVLDVLEGYAPGLKAVVRARGRRCERGLGSSGGRDPAPGRRAPSASRPWSTLSRHAVVPASARRRVASPRRAGAQTWVAQCGVQ